MLPCKNTITKNIKVTYKTDKKHIQKDVLSRTVNGAEAKPFPLLIT